MKLLFMFMVFFSSQVIPCPSTSIMASSRSTVVFHGLIAARTPFRDPAHCSAPPLQASFRLPRLSRDVEAVTRPRSPLQLKVEQESVCGAVFEFGMNPTDVVEFKVEAEEATEAPVDAEPERGVRAQMSALRVAPPAPATAPRRGPGRPKGSTSRPRVEPRFDISAPPDREEARLARARIAGEGKKRR